MLDKCNYLGYNKSCNCGFSSSGRASPCQGEGSEFESRNPLQTKALTNSVSVFLFYSNGSRLLDPFFYINKGIGKPIPELYQQSFLGTILSLPPIYIRSASGIETVPSALRLFSRNAMSILGGATTVLLRV